MRPASLDAGLQDLFCYAKYSLSQRTWFTGLPRRNFPLNFATTSADSFLLNRQLRRIAEHRAIVEDGGNREVDIVSG